MNQFITQYGFCILLAGPGLFFVLMSYGAAHAGRSGVPLFGGLLIALGFLTTPHKWLALLGLIDFGFWYQPYAMIIYHIHSKRFDALYAAHNFIRARDDTRCLRIRIPERNEEFLRPFETNQLHEFRVPKLLLSVCTDKAGARFLLVDHYRKDGQIEILPFEENSILLTGCKDNDTSLTMEIAVVRAESI